MDVVIDRIVHDRWLARKMTELLKNCGFCQCDFQEAWLNQPWNSNSHCTSL
jgi:hypothetical protein